MTRQIYILIAACLLSVCHIQTAKALFIREYTEDHPLTIVSDLCCVRMCSKPVWCYILKACGMSRWIC